MRTDPSMVERVNPSFWKDAREKEEIRRSLAASQVAHEVFATMERWEYYLPADNEKVRMFWLAIVRSAVLLLEREAPPLPAEGTPVECRAAAA